MNWWECLLIFVVALVVLYVLYGLCVSLFVYVLFRWWYK